MADLNDVEFFLAGDATEYKVGMMKQVKLENDRKVLVARTKDGYFATGPKCTHYNAPLVKGVLSGNRVVCPWHGACFNVKTGDIEEAPGIDCLDTYITKIDEKNQLFVGVRKGQPENGRRQPSQQLEAKELKDDYRVVIIGAGAAGQSAVDTLREEGFKGKITLVGKEKYVPYDRPLLSKNLSLGIDKVALRSEKYYEERGVELMLGVSATAVDTKSKTIKLDNGSSLKYDDCIVCTGGTPFNIPVPGHDASNVYTLRTVDDSTAIVNLAKKSKNIVIIGTGFIGLELATWLKKNMMELESVTCVSLDKVPLGRVFGDKLGEALKTLHETSGINLKLNTHLDYYKTNDAGVVTHVVVKEEKEEIPCDFVVVGAGCRVNTSFLADSEGVELNARDKSVLVNEYLQTPSGLYAVGDIARYPYPYSKEMTTYRIEHWNVAKNQGTVAARNIVADLNKKEKVKFTNVPYFWTVLFAGSIRYVGHSEKFDDIVISGNPSEKNGKGKFVAYFLEKDTVAAVATYGRDPFASCAAELIRDGKMPTAKQIKENPDFDLLSLLN